MSPEERAAKIDELRAKLAKREGVPGFKDNVASLKAQIAELEAGE